MPPKIFFSNRGKACADPPTGWLVYAVAVMTLPPPCCTPQDKSSGTRCVLSNQADDLIAHTVRAIHHATLI